MGRWQEHTHCYPQWECKLIIVSSQCAVSLLQCLLWVKIVILRQRCTQGESHHLNWRSCCLNLDLCTCSVQLICLDLLYLTVTGNWIKLNLFCWSLQSGRLLGSVSPSAQCSTVLIVSVGDPAGPCSVTWTHLLHDNNYELEPHSKADVNPRGVTSDFSTTDREHALCCTIKSLCD